MSECIQEKLVEASSNHGGFFKRNEAESFRKRIVLVPARLKAHSLLDLASCRIIYLIILRLELKQLVKSHSVRLDGTGHGMPNVIDCLVCIANNSHTRQPRLKHLSGVLKHGNAVGSYQLFHSCAHHCGLASAGLPNQHKISSSNDDIHSLTLRRI